MAEIDNTLEKLKNHWILQNIPILTNTRLAIARIEKKTKTDLPDDFVKYFTKANGMPNLFPNDIDDEDFLFYPLNEIKTISEEFGIRNKNESEFLLIFAEYMHKSWWYGVNIDKESNTYSICLVSGPASFYKIAETLNDFLIMYLKNASELYYDSKKS